MKSKGLPSVPIQQYRPISNVITAWQQVIWAIMEDVSRINVNNQNVMNFGNIKEYSL